MLAHYEFYKDCLICIFHCENPGNLKYNRYRCTVTHKGYRVYVSAMSWSVTDTAILDARQYVDFKLLPELKVLTGGA